MATEPSLGPPQPPENGAHHGAHSEEDSDPPQLPVIVPASVASETISDPLDGEVPAVVSITRVPAKPKQPEAPPVGGLKVRTDLSAPKPGPPPLLRVAGGITPPPRPSLPPMPKLKLGGQRVSQNGPRFSPSSAVNGMMKMMKAASSPGMLNTQQTGMGAMPGIHNSLSLRQLRPKPPVQVPQASARPGPRSATPKQFSTFIPQPASSLASALASPPSRPVQVRTVFVPPPMKMSGKSPTPTSTGPKVINSFNMNVSPPIPLATSISITPVNKGNTNGIGPVIKGVDASNGLTSPTSNIEDESYDDIELELDEDDEGLLESEAALDNSERSEQDLPEFSESHPIITSVTSLRRPSSELVSQSVSSELSNQKAKKSFKSNQDKLSITISPMQSVIKAEEKATKRRSLEATENRSLEITEKSSLEVTGKRSLEATEKRPLETTEKRPLEATEKRPLEATEKRSLGMTMKRSLEATDKKTPTPEPCKKARLETEPSKTRPVPELTPVVGGLLCSCVREPLRHLSQGTEQVCQAIENVGGHRVGCRNKVTRLEVVRLTERDSAVLCDLHRARLTSHGLCPLCGEFCSHGLVFMCRASKTSAPHLFHRHCYQARPRDQRVCPHCGSKRSPMAVQLKMTMSNTPLRLLNYTAKITASRDKELRMPISESRENKVNYTLPSGKVISADGIPKGLEQNRLDEVIKNFNSKSNLKVTTRNMYHPTAAGDNVKLMQLLAMDYSPKQKFPEADGGTPLHVAAGNNHTLTAHILLQAGADIDAFDDNNETPLMIAAYNGFSNTVRYLITAGAALGLKSDDGMTALHLAAQNGHLECCHILLGTNNLPRNHINVKDDGGWTPLVWACEHKHEPVIRYLLDQGADPFATDVEMNVALHWAAFSGSKDIVELLLSAGSNVNQANAIGETPLHIALRQDHYECALYLITRGSRLDLANNQGHIPANCIDEEKSKAASLIQLGTTLQRLMADRKSKYLTEKTVSLDISNGKETIPITAINGEDLDSGPAGYVYVKNNVITNPLPIERNISALQHCKCRDNCASEETCRCSDMSVRSWYDSNSVLKEGFDFTEPPMIFECNDMCSCNVNTCNNRVVQHGITARMQLYKTYGMGWGVKSLVDIPKGGFVCEYVGELISDAEAEQRENDSYLFDLENRDGDTFCIDANKFGNVTRFINHSCDPNLMPVKVFTSHQDLRFPHIAMFACRDIKKGDILGFDYGEKFWVIKHKFFTCWCGLEKCKYSKQVIARTLDSYYRKNPEEVSKSPDEESRKQTGKLKLKLKMEEGKVVKVDDSLLLPGEKTRGKEKEKGEKSQEKKSLVNGTEDKKQKVVNGTGNKRIVLKKESAKDDIDSSDSDMSKKSSKKKEKSVEKEKAIIDLEEKITQIKGKILQISENKKVEKVDKQPSISPKNQTDKIDKVSDKPSPSTLSKNSTSKTEKSVDKVSSPSPSQNNPSVKTGKVHEKKSDKSSPSASSNNSTVKTEEVVEITSDKPSPSPSSKNQTDKVDKVADKVSDKPSPSSQNPTGKTEQIVEKVSDKPSPSQPDKAENDRDSPSPLPKNPSDQEDTHLDKSTSSPPQENPVEEESKDSVNKVTEDIVNTDVGNQNGSSSEVKDEISKEITDKIIDNVVGKDLSDVTEAVADIADLIASDTELDCKDSKYYCSNCPASFDRDDKMLFHQEECTKSSKDTKTSVETTLPVVKAVANQCPKCFIVINKKGKLARHSRLCKGKKSAPSTPTPPEPIKSEKKLSITNIDEAIFIIDATNLEDRENRNGTETPSSTQSPVPSEPSDEGLKRGRGRPKKPTVDVSNVLDRIPPTVNLKRVSSTSLRSSASSSSNPTSESNPTSNQNSDESSENSGVNSRPKRSRKTVDKDL